MSKAATLGKTLNPNEWYIFAENEGVDRKFQFFSPLIRCPSTSFAGACSYTIECTTAKGDYHEHDQPCVHVLRCRDCKYDYDLEGRALDPVLRAVQLSKKYPRLIQGKRTNVTGARNCPARPQYEPSPCSIRCITPELEKEPVLFAALLSKVGSKWFYRCSLCESIFDFDNRPVKAATVALKAMRQERKNRGPHGKD
jgi:hypothetical protein